MLQIKQFAPTTHKIKAVVYAGPGSGKTTFGGTCPKPIFASAEGGLLSIAHLAPAYAEIKTLQDLAELLAFLRKGGHGFESVVIDSITEISEIIKADIEKRTGKAMQIQDFGTLAKKIRDILRGFRDLDMHVLFIAQEKVEKDGDKIERVMPSLNGKSADEIAYFMDVVGYLTIDPGTQERKVITNPSPKLITKDRTGQIGNNTEPDFSVWVEAVKGLQVVVDEKVLAEYSSPTAEETKAEETAQKTAKAKPSAVPKDGITEEQKNAVAAILDVIAPNMEAEALASKLRGSVKTATGKEIAQGVVATDAILSKLSKEDGRLLLDLLKSKLPKDAKGAGKKPEPVSEAVADATESASEPASEEPGAASQPETPAQVPAEELAGKDQIARIKQLCQGLGKEVSDTGLDGNTTRDGAGTIIRALIKEMNEAGEQAPAPSDA